jgi:hypothetical protein
VIRAVPRPRIPVLLALVVFSTVPSAWAAGLLAWERESIAVTALPGQQVVHVEFPFRNSGDKPVTIVSVETSCRCTCADTSKKVYAPGERDALAVDLAVGAREGVVVQSVTVTTDGAEAEPVYLTLRVTIPPASPAK